MRWRSGFRLPKTRRQRGLWLVPTCFFSPWPAENWINENSTLFFSTSTRTVLLSCVLCAQSYRDSFPSSREGSSSFVRSQIFHLRLPGMIFIKNNFIIFWEIFLNFIKICMCLKENFMIFRHQMIITTSAPRTVTLEQTRTFKQTKAAHRPVDK